MATKSHFARLRTREHANLVISVKLWQWVTVVPQIMPCRSDAPTFARATRRIGLAHSLANARASSSFTRFLVSSSLLLLLAKLVWKCNSRMRLFHPHVMPGGGMQARLRCFVGPEALDANEICMQCKGGFAAYF